MWDELHPSSNDTITSVVSDVGGGADHKEVVDRLTGMKHLERQERLGSSTDGRMTLSPTSNTPPFTSGTSGRTYTVT